MKNLRKHTLIPMGILAIICLIAIVGYKGYSTSKTIGEFSTYVDKYKQAITTYTLTDNQEKYESLIKECEQAISNNDYKNVDSLKSNLSELKKKNY